MRRRRRLGMIVAWWRGEGEGEGEGEDEEDADG